MARSADQIASKSQVTRERIVVAMAAYALIGGLVTLIGWYLDVRRLTDWGGSGISMFANAAVAAMGAGAALVLAVLGWRWASVLSAMLGLGVALIGGATLFEHISRIDLGIDTLLIKQPWGIR